MEHFDGSLRLAHEASPIRVAIDLTDDHVMKISAESVEIGVWPLGHIAFRALDDGFHMIADGEEIVIRTDNDPAFALAVGIRNAPTQLRRQISELMRYDPRFHEQGEPEPET
ncbi:MAG TPA: hypothetical protein VLA54_06195 [Acidimicrobiia bacterium]|nr:hypothetical protein [Acidimicrobiia bacterium]